MTQIAVHPESPFLAPIEHPKGLFLRGLYFVVRRQFGKVFGPLAVFSARMPLAFTFHSQKIAQLDGKLTLPRDTAVLVREQVATLNGCLFCQDAARWAALRESMDKKPKLDALAEYPTSPLFSDAERAALDYATELTRDKHVTAETFRRLASFHGERQICELAWLVASEHMWNIQNVGLGIGSDGMCALDPKLRALTPAHT
jgi:alkylhydroperoxidase family enzyme